MSAALALNPDTLPLAANDNTAPRAGNVTSQTLPSGRTVTYTPDGLGRTVGLSAAINGASQSLASNVSYHAGGSMAGMTYGNGLNFTQTLNARLLPDTVTLDGTVGGTFDTLKDLSYAYDRRGKVTAITDAAQAGQNRSFGYDDVGRLTSATGPWGQGSYTYDALGNLLTKTLGARTVTNIYDTTTNRLMRSEDSGPKGNRNLQYDLRGNVQYLGASRMVYDVTGQPTRLLGNVDGTATVGDYVYDGNLKRAKSDINGQIIYNVYDLSGKLIHVDIRPDANNAGESQTDYIPGFARIKMEGANDTVTYMHDDPVYFSQTKITRGSASLANKGDGSVAWRESYTPYGETLLSPAANDNQGGFTGHIKDKVTGLNYMQARYYDPNMGRFLSIDPVDFMGSGYNPAYFNRYAYSGSDPINNIDPDGEFFQLVGFALGVASNVAIQTLVEGKSLGEVNVVEALTSGAVGATGLGAVSQGAKAIKAVRGAKQVSNNLKKAQRHAQSRSRRGKDSFNADKKVNSLQNEIRGDIKDAGEAVGKAVGAAVGKKVIDETVPEVTVNDVGGAIGSAAQAVSDNFDRALENEVNR